MENNSFCVLPFIHLATHPIGTVTPCCITTMDNDASTSKKGEDNLLLSKNTLDDIANSERFNSIRKMMLNGEKPDVCKTCFFHEKNNLSSKRIEENIKFKHLIADAIENTNENGSLKKVKYKYVELRLGTVCNLKCVTCNPFSSNRWNEDVVAFKDTEFSGSYFKNEIKTEWFRSTTFYDELYEKCEELEEVWINGGEPTLIKEHAYFLNKLIDSGRAKNINIHYSINMTNIPDDFIKIWMQFKKVRLHLSIDDIGERNDYIRTGSKWDVIYDNFKKIIEYKNVFNIEVCQTVSALNVYNIDNFKKLTNDFNLVVAHNYVHQPSYMHVSILPKEMKEQIMANIKHLNDYELKRLNVELFSENNPDESDKFFKFINILDIKRNLFISDHLPEWKKYFTNEFRG